MTAHSRISLRKNLGFEIKYRCNFRDCTDSRLMSLMTATEHQAKHFEMEFRTRAHYNFQCHVCNACFYNKSHHRMCGKPHGHKQYYQTINQVPMTEQDFRLSVEFSRFVNIHLQPVNEEGIPLLPAKRETSKLPSHPAQNALKTSFMLRTTSESTSPGFKTKTTCARSPGIVDQETLDQIQRNKDEFRTVSRGTTRVPPATNRGANLLEELPPPSASRIIINIGGRTPQYDGARSFTAPSTYSCGTPRTPREEDDAVEEPVPAYMRRRSPLPTTSVELGRNSIGSHDNLKPTARKRARGCDLFDQNNGAQTPPPVKYCAEAERYWFDAPVETNNISKSSSRQDDSKNCQSSQTTELGKQKKLYGQRHRLNDGGMNSTNDMVQSESHCNMFSGSRITLPSAITRSRPGGTILLDHIPSQPKHASCSPDPRVSRSPGPRVSRSPGPQLLRSADYRDSSSPGSRLAYSPGPRVARSPIALSRSSSPNEDTLDREINRKTGRDTENSSVVRDPRYHAFLRSRSQNSNSPKERDNGLKKMLNQIEEHRACKNLHDICDRGKSRDKNHSTGRTDRNERGRSKACKYKNDTSEHAEGIFGRSAKNCGRRSSTSVGFRLFTPAKKHRSRSRSYDKSRSSSPPSSVVPVVKNETGMSSVAKRRRERSYSASNSD